MCVYVCIYVCMYVCIYVCMYVCMYVSMYVSMYLLYAHSICQCHSWGRVSCRPVWGPPPQKKNQLLPPKFLLTLFLITLSPPTPRLIPPPKVLQLPPKGEILQETLWGTIWFPVWTDYVMQFWGDAMLTFGPYGSPGTCIVNCAISQFTDPGEREST